MNIIMAIIKIDIPEELNEEIVRFNLDVSGAIIESIKEEIIRFVALKTIGSKSKLIEKDAIELGKKVKQGRYEELKKKGLL